MGLDMYLSKRTYIGNRHRRPAEQTTIDIAGVDQGRVEEVVEAVGYWRKANAIHRWFVENVQDGEDDCREYPVSAAQLQELLGLVETVLADHAQAKELLPTTEGFFFGSTDYDEDYFADLKQTKAILQQAVKENGDYYYQSSW